jgi:hypothetical protein
MKWYANPRNWWRHTWYLKRTVEHRLLGGRPFPY